MVLTFVRTLNFNRICASLTSVKSAEEIFKIIFGCDMYFFLEKMVNDPREMFEHYADLTKMYDFDLISHQQKAEFIEMVFLGSKTLQNVC